MICLWTALNFTSTCRHVLALDMASKDLSVPHQEEFLECEDVDGSIWGPSQLETLLPPSGTTLKAALAALEGMQERMAEELHSDLLLGQEGSG